MSYSSWSVVFGEQPSAAKWNILGENDESFNDGTGFLAGAIQAVSLGDHIKFGSFSANGTDNLAITGVGFTPKLVLFLPTFTTSVAVTGNGNGGWGLADGTNQAAYSWGSRASTTHGGGRILATDRCYSMVEFNTAGVGSVGYDGSLVSMDADGFTVDRVTAGAFDVYYVALG